MVVVTGDMHGDITRFNDKNIKKLKKGDTLMVCGDFGFLWTGDKKEKKILKQLGKKKYNIMFVEGCHENFSLLLEYPKEEYCGGEVRRISGNLMQMVRGNIFTIEGNTFFAFGGGQEIEENIRRESNTFWKEALPTVEEINFGVENLNKSKQTVDYLITHEPPGRVKDFLGLSVVTNDNEINELNTVFNIVSEKCTFKRWFFGKCHKNKVVSQKYNALFTDVVVVPTNGK